MKHWHQQPQQIQKCKNMVVYASKEIEEKIDLGQFETESKIVVAKAQNPYYIIHDSDNRPYIGNLLEFEQENKVLSFKMLCRATDVGAIVLNKDKIQKIDFVNGSDIIDSFYLKNKKVKKFGIYKDNPADSEIYAVYIRFE